MSIWLRITRWSLAVPVAALSFIVGMLAIIAIWQRLGGDAATAYIWAVATGTILGTALGALIVPSDQRRLASWGFASAVVSVALISLIIGLVDHRFEISAIYEVCGSLLGGGIAIRAFRRHDDLKRT